jgi:hypothetical protein
MIVLDGDFFVLLTCHVPYHVYHAKQLVRASTLLFGITMVLNVMLDNLKLYYGFCLFSS